MALRTERTPTGPVRPLLVGMEWCDDMPGGLNRYVGDLHSALTTAGCQPYTLVTGPMAGSVPGVQAVSTWSTPLAVRLASFAAVARRRRGDYDVVDAHFALTAVPVLLAALRRDPFVVHFHGPWAQESRSDGAGGAAVAVKAAVERWVYRRARRVIVLSDAFGRLLVERYGVAPFRVEVVRPGVDLRRFTPGDVVAARERLDLPAGAFVALSVRRLIPRVGLGDLLDSWSRSGLAARGGLLLVAGTGPERPALEQRVRELGIADSVRLLGRVSDEDLVRCYQAADVSVVPSVELEGFGLVVLESLACGTPVIATQVGGLPEILRELRPDLLVPPSDAPSLAGRLTDAATGRRPLPDPAACRAHARGYGWESAAARHTRIYAAAADRRARPSVVYLDHCALLSGAELALARLLPALRDDIDAHVILGEDGPLSQRLRAAGVSVEVLPMPAAARTLRRDRVRGTVDVVRAAMLTAGYCLRLRARLRALRPDLVHTNSLKAALYGGLAARAAGVPVVWHVRDRIAPDYLPSPAVRLVTWCARWFPAALIANSAATRTTLGRLARRVTVVPSPIEAPAGSPPARHGPLTVGVVGRLAPWKGQDLFLRAFAAAFPGGPERAVLVGEALFGEGEYAAGLRGLAADLGIADRVEFRGFREDVPAELAAMDILVHSATLPEPFGQVVVEGMAAGLPVVAPAAGGPAETVTHDVDGLLYQMGDQAGLAAALRNLAAEPDLRRRLGDAARTTARRYTPETVAGDVMAVYRRVLARN